METSAKEFKDQGMSKNPLDVERTTNGASRFMTESSDFPIAETFKQMKSKTVEVYDSSIQVVRENPVKSMALALGLGLATGYLMKRRQS